MASRDGSIPKRHSKSSKNGVSNPPSPPLMTLSSTSSTASSVTAGGNKLSTSSKMMKSRLSNNYVGTYYDYTNKAYTASITRNAVKVHLGSYRLGADAAFAYDRASKVMIPPATGNAISRREFNFATVKDYEKAKKTELTMLGWSKDAAMTSGEITTKVNDIISKRCGNYDFDSSGDSSEEFDESSDNDEDEDQVVVEDESDVSPLEVSSSATDIKVTEDDTKKSGNKGKMLKRDKKWICPKCEGDVRLPPQQKNKGEDEEKSSVNDYLNTTHVMCALKKCPDPRYHLTCSGVPRGSQIYRNAILCCQPSANNDEAIVKSEGGGPNNKCDAKHVLEHLYSSSSKSVWWDLPTETKLIIEGKERSHRSLQMDKNWPTSMLSFTCPSCDVEGASRYLLEYFEQFGNMKRAFYEDYLNVKDKDMIHRRDRADESAESRTGEAFLWHLMKHNRQDYLNKKEATGDGSNELNAWDWTPSEIQLAKMTKILTYLSKQLQQQQKEQHRRRQKRQKNTFHLDPSYLVGMPIRLYNPIDNSYHSGRIIDFRVDAPHQIDEPLSNLKSSDNSSVPNIGKLTDEKVASTLFLIRFREGVEGRKIAVHKWIYLEEHAVTVGTNICWAKVGNEIDDTNDDDESDTDVYNDMKLKADDYISPYQPVQLVFRSMLEMIPVQNFNTENKKSSTGAICVLAAGFGQALGHIRLSLSDGGTTAINGVRVAKGSEKETAVSSTTTEKSRRPVAIPLTASNPPWLNRILHRAQLSDEDVALGLAMACTEKEEERRIRTWRHLSVSHLFQPSPVKRKYKASPSSVKSMTVKRPVQFRIPPTVCPQTKKRRTESSNSKHMGHHEVSLEVAASSGCRKCMDEHKTKVKTTQPHDPSCPRKRHTVPSRLFKTESSLSSTTYVYHEVSLEAAASSGCKKCMDEHKTKVKTAQPHDSSCPRKRHTVPSRLFKTESSSPGTNVVRKKKAKAKRRNQLTKVPESNKMKQARSASIIKKLKDYVRASDPRPIEGCRMCGPTKEERYTCDSCKYLKSEEGWSMTVNAKARKRHYTNAEGKSLKSMKDFLRETTDLVVKKKKRDAKK